MRGTPKILVCDDEPLVLEVMVWTLEGLPAEVVGVPDGEQAVKQLRSERFDLLLCDKNLPGMSGLEVARQARSVDRELAIIIVTANGSRESAQEAVGLRVDDYLLKPVDVEDLEAKVREVLELRAHRLEALSETPPGIATRRIVVLEPDEATCAALTEAIEALGYAAMVVDSVGEVVSAIRTRDCRAVVCDVTALDAEEASACFLKAALAMAGDLPFVAVSPVESLRPTVLAISHGARHVLYRPLAGLVATSSELGAAFQTPLRTPVRPARSSDPPAS